MVNVNPPKAPDMEVIDGVLVRPEDVERFKARSEARNKARLPGAQDVTPIGVPRGTDNRRKTQRELYDGDPVDPADSVLSREPAGGTDPAAAATKTAAKKAAAKSGQ